MKDREELVFTEADLSLIGAELEHRVVVKISLSQYIRFQEIRMALWKIIPNRRIPTYSEVVDFMIDVYHSIPKGRIEGTEHSVKERMDQEPLSTEV